MVFILATAYNMPIPSNVFKFKTGGHSTIANIGLDYVVVDPRSKISQGQTCPKVQPKQIC